MMAAPILPTTPRYPTAGPRQATAPGENSLNGLVLRLGQQTHVGLDGIVRFNEPLVRQIAAHREAAIPVLSNILSTTPSIPAFLEGLYTADQMVESGVRGMDQLYPAVSRWNTNPDPLVQIYLAGFYRKLNTPPSFGPLFATLVHQAVNNYPAQASPTHNISEEVGGALLQQIAETTAKTTVQQLLPYLNVQQATRPANPKAR